MNFTTWLRRQSKRQDTVGRLSRYWTNVLKKHGRKRIARLQDLTAALITSFPQPLSDADKAKLVCSAETAWEELRTRYSRTQEPSAAVEPETALLILRLRARITLLEEVLRSTGVPLPD